MRNRSATFVMFSLIFLTSMLARADDNNASSIRFSGIPAVGYGPDEGFGGGLVGSMYVDEEGYLPYKMAIGAKVYLTTRGINAHYLQLDRVRAFGLPWRLIGRLGFYSTVTENYCGRASDAKCDADRANIEANSLNLRGSDRDEFIKRYYQHRFMSFYGDIFSRWLLWQDVAKLELMTSYRGNYYLNRDFRNVGPYPGSLYDQDYRNFKTEGYLSTLELGLMLDKRDNEPAPTSGYWLESSVRGASSFTGSAWDYFGVNVAARFYVPLDDGHRLLIASQSIVDAIVGDLPFDAMSRVGGSLSLNGISAIGGQNIGRGISEQLFVGRFKAIEQLEFRYTFLSFDLFKQNFDLTAAALGDFAMTAWDYSRFTKDMQNIYAGFGAGLRIHWNKTFIVRADLGVSPSENFSPKFYLAVGNVF